MRRRGFLGLVGGGASAWTAAAWAQPGKVPKIGMLVLGSPDPTVFLKALTEALRELGYIDGKTTQIEVLSADGKSEMLPGLVAELVRRKVDVIMAWQTPVIAAAKQITRDVPIVMGSAADPIGSGLIETLAKPGGNITGVANATAALSAKSVEFMRELLPGAKRVAMLANAADPFHKAFLEQVTLAGQTAGLDMRPLLVREPGEIDSAFAHFPGERIEAIIAQPSLPIQRIADLALQYRIPTTASARPFFIAGGVLAYVSNFDDQARKVAIYIDRILKGARPADLPVQEPTTFELLINTKTAKAMGIAVPPSLLSRADEVIE